MEDINEKGCRLTGCYITS